MTLSTAFIAPNTYETSADTMRHLIKRAVGQVGPGPVGAFTLTPSGSDLSLTTQVTGFEWILQGSNPNQGYYYVWSEDVETINFDVANTNPRWDTIVLKVADSEFGITGGDGPNWQIVKGTPASSPVKNSDATVIAAVTDAGAWQRVADIRIGGSATVINPGADVSITATDVYAPLVNITPGVSLQAGGALTTWVDVSSGSITPPTFKVPTSGKFTVRLSASITNNSGSSAWLSYHLNWSGGSNTDYTSNGTKGGASGSRATAVRTFRGIATPGTVVTLNLNTWRGGGTAAQTAIDSILLEVLPEPW